MSRLHPIKHNKRGVLWCGPAALSAITGYGTAEIHRVLEALTHQKSIKGVGTSALIKAAEQLGCNVTEIANYQNKLEFIDKSKRPTLVQFAHLFRATLTAHSIIVCITGHYVVLSGRQFIDNHTGHAVPFGKALHRRARVAAAWVVTPGVRPPNIPAEVIPPARDYSLAKARRLAKEHGITVEPHTFPGEFWVYPPDHSHLQGERDPYEDEHLGYDHKDVLKRVETYVKLLTEPKS